MKPEANEATGNRDVTDVKLREEFAALMKDHSKTTSVCKRRTKFLVGDSYAENGEVGGKKMMTNIPV